MLQIKRVARMTGPTVAWVLPTPNTEEPPLPPDRREGWIRGTSADGRFAIDEILHGGPGYIAIPFSTEAARTVVLQLCHYLALRVWIDDDLVYEGKVVPFEYRGTEDFPSVHPLRIDVPPGQHWLIADVTHARQHWHFGVYAADADVTFAPP